MQVEAECFLVLENRKSFGVGLHQPVLDAVVNHLGEMACAHRADAAPTLVFRGGQRLEDRSQALPRARIAADHQAVALGKAPYTAARAAIDELDARGGERRGATHA